MINRTILILLFFYAFSLSAQSKDTLTTYSKKDSLAMVDTTVVKDTLAKKNKVDVDAIIYASASDSLIFSVAKKKMYIYRDGNLKYKTAELSSGIINIDFRTNELEAFSVTDSADSTGKLITKNPKLSDAGENYEGSYIQYNFKTKGGYIEMAKNKGKEKIYGGSKVRKVNDDTYFVEDGLYTTCDADPPHTHFVAKKMKVINKEQIIIKWGMVYFVGVPFPVPIPFAVFPTRKGRHSGIIPPGYGASNERGQAFTNFGYYWAMNDYMDLAVTADYYSKGSWGLRSNFNYRKRYNYSGYLQAGYSGNTYEDRLNDSHSWNLGITHNQNINPTSSLNINLSFQSSDYYRNNSTNYDELLRQNIFSNATYNKRFEDLGASLTLNYNRTQNLSQNGDVRETLPSISFNKTQFYPFRRANIASKADQKWYELIGISYSGNFKNNRNKINNKLFVRGGVKHDIDVSAAPKIGYFNIAPRVNYVEKWYNKRIEKKIIKNKFGKDTLITEDVRELNFIRNYDIGISASTKLYGMLQANTLGIEAFRHTITPSISYSYSPDFSDKKYGYYQSYIDENGKERKYDIFEREIYGGAQRGERQRISFSVGNVFEMKTLKDPTDTTSQAKKIRLLNLSLGTGYDFARDSLCFSDLSISFNTQIGSILNIDGASSYSFYNYNKMGNRINEYLIKAGKGLLRNTNFRFNISTSFSGEKLKGKDEKENSQEDNDEFNTFKTSQYETLYREEEPDFSIPWNISLSYSYSENKNNPYKQYKNSNINVNAGFNLTENWKFNVRGSYDFNRNEVSSPTVTINRDLHCWEMSFNWKPIGIYRGFRFELRMKAPELRDVKVTKTGGINSRIR